MFVSDRRFIVKTCGTTNLLNTVEPLLKLARKYADLDQVAVSSSTKCLTVIYNKSFLDLSFVKILNYSRRNFLRPELQPVPHKSFDEEVSQLDKTFDSKFALSFFYRCHFFVKQLLH